MATATKARPTKANARSTGTAPASEARASPAKGRAGADAPPKWAMTAARKCMTLAGLDADEHLDATAKAARAIHKAAREAAARGTLTAAG